MLVHPRIKAMSQLSNNTSGVPNTNSMSRVQDSRQDAIVMPKTKPPAPALRLSVPGGIPVDVHFCFSMACSAASSYIFAYIPRRNPRRVTGQTPWDLAFWTYLCCCLHFADMVLDRQARHELFLQKQSMQVHDQDDGTSVHTEQTQTTELCDEPKASLTTSRPQSSSSHVSDEHIQPRNGRRARGFRARLPIDWNPRRHSSKQLIRKATIICALMIQGLVLLPVILYLGQKLFSPEDEVEEMARNIPSWSLLFWSFSLLGISLYGSILEKRKQRAELKVHDKMEQPAHQRVANKHDEEVGQCD